MTNPEYYYEKDKEPKEKGFWHVLPWVILIPIGLALVAFLIIKLTL